MMQTLAWVFFCTFNPIHCINFFFLLHNFNTKYLQEDFYLKNANFLVLLIAFDACLNRVRCWEKLTLFWAIVVSFILDDERRAHEVIKLVCMCTRRGVYTYMGEEARVSSLLVVVVTFAAVKVRNELSFYFVLKIFNCGSRVCTHHF